MTHETIIHKLVDILKYKEMYQQETAGLLPQDMYVLERIYFAGSIYPKELSVRYNLAPSTLTGIFDRLEKRLLIERIRPEGNKKSILLQNSHLGKTLIEEHIKEDKIFTANLLKVLPEDKSGLLMVLMEELVSKVVKEDLFKED